MTEDALRVIFRDWERGDWTTAPRLFAPGIRFSGAQPEGQVEAVGPTGIARFMRRFLAEWESYRVEVHELEHVATDRFLARGTQHGLGARGGVAITAPVFIAIVLDDGLITRLEFWLEPAPALRTLAG
jgi:hypothetical protein